MIKMTLKESIGVSFQKFRWGLRVEFLKRLYKSLPGPESGESADSLHGIVTVVVAK